MALNPLSLVGLSPFVVDKITEVDATLLVEMSVPNFQPPNHPCPYCGSVAGFYKQIPPVKITRGRGSLIYITSLSLILK